MSEHAPESESTACSKGERQYSTDNWKSGPSPSIGGPGTASRVGQRAWWILYSLKDYLALLVGHIPSHRIRLFVYRRLLSVRVGHASSIHLRCRFYNPGAVVIGHNTVINNDVLLDGRCGLNIGDNVSVSEGTMILTLGHDIDSAEFAGRGKRVRIRNHVFIGARAMILPGVELGEGCVIGAGSVVTRSVDPYVVAVGVPARAVRQRRRNLRYRLEYRKLLG